MTPQALAATYAKAFDDTRGWSADEIANLLAHPTTFVSGDADSFAMVRVVADEAEVLTIATDPAVRRQGHARKALSAAHARAKAMGAIAIFLEVAEDNVAARALYASFGYTQVGQRRGYYKRAHGPAVAAFVLRRGLNFA
jgi:ribosomal-protein-alanine N-acetyltransferase